MPSGLTSAVTRMSAIAGIDVPATVPRTVNEPGEAYCDGSTASQETGTVRVTPSVYLSVATAGRNGASPTATTVEYGSTLSTAYAVTTARATPRPEPRLPVTMKVPGCL